jgi:hypothetical protein
MGSGTTVVALVRYSSYNVKEAGKPKPISQLEVSAWVWPKCKQVTLRMNSNRAAAWQVLAEGVQNAAAEGLEMHAQGPCPC